MLVLSFLCMSAPAFADGITFFEGSWSDALTSARSQRKLIFVDAYTEWCGPCKMMSRNTFPSDQVGELFNESFVNLKLDMEKGEGISFGAKYQVNAYPTLLFLNHKGEVVHKVLGYLSPSALIKEAQVALQPENSLSGLELAFEQGTSNRDSLYMLAMTYHKMQDRRAYEVGERFFSTIAKDKELLLPENWEAMLALTVDIHSREYQYLLLKQKKFIKQYGYQPVLDKLYDLLKKAAISSALTRNDQAYRQALEIAQNQLKDDGRTALRLQMVYAEASRNWPSFAVRAVEYFDRYIIVHPKELSNAAKHMYLHIQNEEQLEQAIAWTRQSIAIENAGYNNLILAQLLAKTGSRVESLRQAYRAKSLLDLEGSDTREVEALIRTLE